MVFKNRHLILLICASILVLNLTAFSKALHLLYLFVILIFSSTRKLLPTIDFYLIDILCSVLVIITFIAFSILIKKPNILDKKVSVISFFTTILIFFFTVPSLITDTPPEYYNNINLTKLLKPFSSVYYSRNLNYSEDDHLSTFLALKEDLLRTNFQNQGSYNEKLISSNSNRTNKKVFILGSDQYGRDVASRLIYGTRISFVTAILAVSVSLFLGLFLGFTSGYTGGFVDIILNRIVEMLLSFPIIFLIILFVALFGSSLLTIILLLGFTGWMTLFKVVRSEVILLKRKDFFISSKLLGSSRILLLKECLPALSASVLLTLIFQFSNVILAESALSYLGLGTGTSYPSWGAMIQEGQNYIYTAWWMVLLPGAFLIISLSIVNSIGKKLSTFDNFRLRYDKR